MPCSVWAIKRFLKFCFPNNKLCWLSLHCQQWHYVFQSSFDSLARAKGENITPGEVLLPEGASSPKRQLNWPTPRPSGPNYMVSCFLLSFQYMQCIGREYVLLHITSETWNCVGACVRALECVCGCTRGVFHVPWAWVCVCVCVCKQNACRELHLNYSICFTLDLSSWLYF